ncbi:D-xylose reductase (Xyl1), putative [Talaromyces stipitatus ATCC 10500]|uniref:D-xylose reductase [NAD(P)H] n=1 Tax=Talaromyces stipitatus (strain ATCC 10500 / CBS 375.48 / QM 6759 / NRRL 1006) TaxID=441959 RepID=B8MH03_TALSN|nr:D-xylose reductase (Xyl1), putative [Talaromyces stipitatus ATCC 10500]EED16817.1 D-xylose reductase (Xyl1), putative [Talaromyces stipitatus ATCC 10500]
MSSPTVKLNSGYDMPLVGFGLWKVNNDTCADQVYAAIKAGYRLFDGACDYGNEKEVGQGIARAIKDGLVKREELFIVSKLWNTFHDGDKVEPIARKQLDDLGLDYFDLYLIHFPVALKWVDPAERYPPGWTAPDGKVEFSKATIQETWQAMESLVDKKLSRSIGISNFSVQLIMDLLRHARIRPATLQIEHHPYLQQKELIKYVQSEGIVITAYSSFGPLSFIELDMSSAHNTPKLFDHDVIKSTSQKHGKTPAQILLRWATQRNIAVIPKSNDPTRLSQNLDVTGWSLEQSDIDAINGLDLGLRFNDPLNYGIYIPIFA